MNAREKARQVVSAWASSTCGNRDGQRWDGNELKTLEDAITAALTVPAGHIRDEHGVDRKVIFDGYAVQMESKSGEITHWTEVFESRDKAARMVNASMYVAHHELRPAHARVIPVVISAALAARTTKTEDR